MAGITTPEGLFQKPVRDGTLHQHHTQHTPCSTDAFVELFAKSCSLLQREEPMENTYGLPFFKILLLYFDICLIYDLVQVTEFRF